MIFLGTLIIFLICAAIVARARKRIEKRGSDIDRLLNQRVDNEKLRAPMGFFRR